MSNKRDVINTVAGSSKRKTPESRNESPLLPPPEFPTATPSVPQKRYVLDTDLRLGVGPHAPCTEEQGGGGLELDLTLSLKHQNEHVGMLEEIRKRENQQVAIQLKEKDKEIDAARARMYELEQMVESLRSINHMLMAELGEVARLIEALGIVGGNGVPAHHHYRYYR